MDEKVEAKGVVTVECPCCGSTLVIEAATGAVVEFREQVNPRKTAELKEAEQLLKEESSRIHDKYRQIVEADKGRGDAMAKKFKDFMDKAKDEPAPARPVRDIDLD